MAPRALLGSTRDAGFTASGTRKQASTGMRRITLASSRETANTPLTPGAALAHTLGPMRIVLYNFVQPGRTVGKQGGGVAIYQANLLQALRARGHEITFLSSGDQYALFRTDPHLAFENDGLARVAIVNSPVFAPAHFTFHKIDAYTDHPGLDPLAAELRERLGPVDVFHFQNVEGLSAGFLRALRRAFPDAAMLLSAHNYNLVCPQVNLWWREHRTCTDYRDGRACVNCLMFGDRHRFERNIRLLNELTDRLRIARFGPLRTALKWAVRAPPRTWRALSALARRRKPAERTALVLTSDARSEQYRRYRETNVALCEEVFDRVLAVSRRTRDVLAAHGVPASRLAVSYIGTAQAARFARAERVRDVGDGPHIAFLGYMRADKGFYFLLGCLEALPDRVAARTSVTVAAPIIDAGAVERLKAMAHRFRAITLHDGYTQRTLDKVLAGVNLGVVPVLWEDNLPQVAIEMVARGIPILTSSRGGAREIADNDAFTFTAGSESDFCRRLDAVASGRLPLARFWDNEPRILSMDDHLADLLTHYAVRQPAPQPEAELAAAV